MNSFVESIGRIKPTPRIIKLRQQMQNEPRSLSVEQAKHITQAYIDHENESRILKRAYGIKYSLERTDIGILDGELICGNRTKESCGGVVFPEGGLSWLTKEIDDLPTRAQDKFLVNIEDREYFFKELVPFWQGKSLEDSINSCLPKDIYETEVVGKLNQKDHAQGHICPSVETWLKYGPKGLIELVLKKKSTASAAQSEFYDAEIIVLSAACNFFERYASSAKSLLGKLKDSEALNKLAEICSNLSKNPPSSFHEALQSLWFLFVLLQFESNASSFSPGRVDQYLYPYYKNDIEKKIITDAQALELIDQLFIKFNQIVYMRSAGSAEFFAGFPIGFNMSLGGIKEDNTDACNELTYLFLRAQEHMYLRQPNLSARVHAKSSELYLKRITEVVSKGSGMPQVVNDEAIIPTLLEIGIDEKSAKDYAIIGCVEISTQGNNLGFSDASMFNMVKMLELTLNNGVCLLTGKQIGLQTGFLADYKSFEELETAFQKQLEYFVGKMILGLELIEEKHKEFMPSPILSCVVDDCIERGVDITAGGARYNYSGIQLIQVANIADCMAALKLLVFDNNIIDKDELQKNLYDNFSNEVLRQKLLNDAPKYGNDIEWVDKIGLKWVERFSEQLKKYKNYRCGKYHIGLYTVSAHVPMGKNVGATPDGRHACDPLADGGLSAVYGRDTSGPTALMKSVSRIESKYASNGSLLNMKFSPQLFKSENGISKFCSLLRVFIDLKINHVQFNVINRQDLIDAKAEPEKHRNLLIRVAGYSANYVELSERLQDEILLRTEYGMED